MVANFDDDADEPEVDEEGEVEELILDIEDECSGAFDNEQNGKMLEEIFEVARANFQKDRKAWKAFFNDLKFELIATDDEDNMRDILSHHLRKARLELS